MNKPIQFTQFMRPDGRRKPVTIDRPEEVADKAALVIEAGGRFAVEHAWTGHASFTCEWRDQDIAIKVCENGPAVLDAVDRVVEDALQYIRSVASGAIKHGGDDD